jgi:hypothetical protein
MKYTLSKSINTIAIISDEDNHINISLRHPEGRRMYRAIMRYIAEEGHTLYDTQGVCLIGDVSELMGDMK